MSADLWIMTLIGLGLGLILEGAGFGSPKKLTGVFLLRDFAVPQVMVTAILTAMGALLLLGIVGVDTASYFTPGTRVGAQAVGGLIFGFGFFVGGYCPGTSVVGLASGKLDALAFMAGLVGGYYFWDPIRSLLDNDFLFLERSTLADVLGIHPMLLAALFVAGGGAVIVWLYRRSRRAPVE